MPANVTATLRKLAEGVDRSTRINQRIARLIEAAADADSGAIGAALGGILGKPEGAA